MLRKGQIQMLETISVLFIFFVLIFLGIIFYGQILQGNIEEQRESSVQLRAVEVAQRASTLPELQCSEDNVVTDNCIDLLKLEGAEEVITENQIYYFDRLFFSKIEVEEVYPNKESWVVYDRTPQEFSSKVVTNLPISIKDPITGEMGFGVMNVSLFLR